MYAKTFKINELNFNGIPIIQNLIPFRFEYSLNSQDSIFEWLQRFEMYLCELGVFQQWLKELANAINRCGEPLTALADIKDEKQLKSIYGTLERANKQIQERPYSFIMTPQYQKYFAYEDSIAIIQAWLDCQTKQTRALIQPKLQQAIKQLNFRQRRKEADLVAINTYLPKKTIKIFEAFRKQHGLNKEEALDFLILKGIEQINPKSSH